MTKIISIPFSLLLASCSFFFMVITSPQAGPWTQANKGAQFIMKLSWYHKKKDFNSKRRLTSADSFDKIEFAPYLEYGLSDDLTIGGQLYADHLISRSSGSRHKETGLADSDLFARYQLYKTPCHVISLQGLIKVPGPYNKKHNPSLGAKQVDLEPRLLYGYSHYGVAIPWYLALEAGYRFRLESPADQIRFDATLGIKLTERLEVMLQSYNTISMKNQGKGQINNPFGLDYDEFVAAPSLLISLNSCVRLQMGGTFTYAGRKVGQGNTGLVAIWIDF